MERERERLRERERERERDRERERERERKEGGETQKNKSRPLHGLHNPMEACLFCHLDTVMRDRMDMASCSMEVKNMSLLA